MQQTMTVVAHAIETPQPVPSQAWLLETLHAPLGGRDNIDSVVAAMTDFTCRDYLELHRVARKQLSSSDYMKLLRAAIAEVLREKTAEA